MKRTLTLLLIIALLLSMSACGGSENGAPTGETQSATVGAVSGAGTETATTITPSESVPNITIPPTTEPKPTNPKPTEPQMQDWRTAYLNFLESAKDHHSEFALVYIDGDDIPELYLEGFCEAEGDAVCTYKNGQVIEQRLRRNWGGYYIPGAGLIKNTNGNMGYYTTDIYRLTDSGFESIWGGLEVQEIAPPANENEEVTLFSTFSIGDQTVSEEAYYAAIEGVFNTSQAVPLHKNAVSFDSIQRLILEN